jgi:uncharacterized membrane protein
MRALRLSIAALYLAAGCLHLIAPDGFLPIMPDWIPYKRDVVILTGVCELFGAAGLAFPATQRAAGVALALYALCVFPANIKQAFDHIAVAGIPDTWWYHGPRLLLQPVLIWATLFSVGVLSWPLRAGETRSRNAERVHDPRRP